MKFSCERSILQTAVSTAGRAVAGKTSIPALEGILLETRADALRMTGYNLETGIRTEVPADIMRQGSIVLSARLFGEIIRRLPDDIVTIHVENYTAHITCAMSEFHIQGIAPEEFPELPSVDEERAFSIEQHTLRAMLGETLFAVSTQDIRPVHTGSLFEVDDTGLTIVSVDGYRLALRHEPLEHKTQDEGFSFVVPGAALSEVERLCTGSDEMITVTQGARHILFQTGDTILVTRRLEGEFLNYRQSLPKQNHIHLVGETAALVTSIERVSLILSDKIKAPLRCTFGDGTFSVSTRATTGQAADQCQIEGDGEGLEIGFDHRFLSDALKAAPASRVRLELGSSVAPCVILPEEENDGRFLYLVLPVRLKAGE